MLRISGDETGQARFARVPNGARQGFPRVVLAL
jgi:hypothetical protein